MPKAILSKFLCISGQLTKPDGRSLYAYRCTDNMYEEIKTTVKTNLKFVLKNKPVAGFDALFCIFAAETWKRYYSGDRSYEFFFKVLAEPVPDQNRIRRDWIAKGIKWWGLDLRKRNGHTRYFDTVACEGGLPLLLLRNDQDAGITRYLKEFLEQYYKHVNTTGFDAEALAEEIAERQRLPKAWRDESVYQIVIQLVEAIINLQARIPNAVDPVAALYNLDSNWRRALPISSVDDEVVVQLIKTLLGDIEGLVKINKPLRWQRRLLQSQGGWQIVQAIDLPKEFNGERLLAIAQVEKLPVRLRLLLSVNGQQRVIAHLTCVQGSGVTAVYRCDKRNFELLGLEALQESTLLLADGISEYEISVEGNHALSELTWTFIEKNAEKLLFSEASARTKSSTAWVVAPYGSQLTLNELGESTDLGRLQLMERQVYQVKGHVLFTLADSDSCEISCNSVEECEQSFNLVGRNLMCALNKRLIFHGLPKLQRHSPELGKSFISIANMEWRPVNDSLGAWRSSQWDQCYGVVWLRYRDRINGSLIYRQKVDVLPTTTRLEVLTVGNNIQPGVLVLSGLNKATVTLQPNPEVISSIDFDSINDAYKLTFSLANSALVNQVTLNIKWSEGRQISLELPVPCEGAAFMMGEKTAPSRCSIERLGAIRVVGQGNAFNYRLESEILVNGQNIAYLSLPPTKLSRGQDGRLQFALHQLQDRLSARLSMTNKLDSAALLKIYKGSGLLASITVARFDISFEQDRLERTVFFTTDKTERLGVDWEDRLQVKMFPLWNPKAQALNLNRVNKAGCFAWDIPANLGTGPWWILGYDGLWPRFRPSLWFEKSADRVPDDFVELDEEGDEVEYRYAPTVLSEAIREPNENIRKIEIDAIIKAMGADVNHSDWPVLHDFIALSNDYPASAFDVLRALINCPDTLCLALIKSSEDNFDSVWRLAYQLSFSWHLMPVSAWLSASILYFGGLKEQFKQLNIPELNDETVFKQFVEFRRRAIGRGHRFLGLIFSWIQLKLFFEEVLACGVFDEVFVDLNNGANQLSSFEDKLIKSQEELQGRHDADAVWHEGPDIKHSSLTLRPERQFRNQGYRRSVLCAPFVAAQIALSTGVCSTQLLFELGNIRDFDREWFDQAYYYELCIGLAGQLSTH
ncbi:MAG: hypothetical protein D4R63_02960 [Methylococcaceae bacterium]|nr:MAG: hypothetical protein D4R63_02960 [Methylococcaceae bacterium]